MSSAEMAARAEAEDYAAWFRALADGTRVKIVSLLARHGRPMKVAEIVAAVQVGQSTVSQHLKVLAAVRFVLAERRGTARYYRINAACVSSFPTAAALVGGLAAPSVHSSTEESTYTVASETRTQMVFEQGFSPVVKSSAPAVVNISSSRIVRPEEGPQAPLNDPFLKKFFGEEFMRQFRVPRERREHSLGSGVIVNSAGYVLTNSHVVEGASDIKVVLSDKREMAGKVVGSDPGTDIAVVKIPTDHLSVLPFADSSKVAVGVRRKCAIPQISSSRWSLFSTH